MAATNGKHHVFLTEETITNALAFAVVPGMLGELSKDKKKLEHFEFTSCYDSEGVFLGFAIEKKLLEGAESK